MAFIRHIAPSEAGGRLAQVYREVRIEIPRVPNLLQVFSLRPETMEGVYRIWIALMWSGRTSRKLKEKLAVAIARAARCPYCVDAHAVYLLAAGASSEEARAVAENGAEAAFLDGAEREALRFAIRLTAEPRTVRREHREAFVAAWPDAEQRVELVAVIAALNSVARLANALGVSSEIPSPLLRFSAGRRSAIGVLGRLTALSVDMSEKAVPGSPLDEDREGLHELFVNQLGFGSLPPGYELLEHCPEVFDAQLRIMKKAVAVMPRDRWMRTCLVIAKLTGCDYFARAAATWMEGRGEDPAEVIASAEGSSTRLADGEQACLRFARDLTMHSHVIDEPRIAELRRLGLSDGAILDLAYGASTLNGMVRLVLGLAPN